MRVMVVLLALASAFAIAADNAVIAPRTATSLKPQAPSLGTEAITIPQMLSYQGRLTDTLGQPVPNGNYSVAFKLYAVPTGGSSFWGETQSVTTRGGLFSVLLGAVTPIGSMPDAGAAYLGMAVGGGAELTPRLRIASAAYAYLSARAANADLVQGKDTTGFVRTGQVNSVTSAMITNATIAAADLGQMGAASGQVLKWTGSQWAPRNDSIGSGGIPDSIPGSLAIGGELRVHSKARLGHSCYNTGAAAFSAGYGSSADGDYSSVTGGEDNSAGGRHSHVGGGSENVASRPWATVGGGNANASGDTAATVAGGRDNSTGARYAAIGGGQLNQASGGWSSVPGGLRNLAGGQYSVAAGHFDSALGRYCGALSGYGNRAGHSEVDSAATVAGGYGNTAVGDFAFVGGGFNNGATVSTAVVGGGWQNYATHIAAAVGGGSGNRAAGSNSVVPGGLGNRASGDYSSIGGGISNLASAYASVAFGSSDTAAAAYSLAANANSLVPEAHGNSAAFNGQTTTASNQTRVGALSKASGTFTIDHPLDPAGRILNHYFIEGPEMRNIYEGAAVLDASGRAEVRLPDYFDALNRNPHVQLTGVGTFEVYVAEEVIGNRFAIGGKPGTKVFWQVTGERKDVSAEATRRMMPVEQPKTGPLSGRMLDDEFLSGCMGQLVRDGKAQGIDFRTAGGRARYEKMKQHLREAEQK